MIFGGLEIVAGGYLVHRHYRKKSEKERLVDEAQQRRHNTFPGAKPNGWNTQAQHRPQHHYQPQPQPMIPQQKYACYAPAVQPQPLYQYQASVQPQHQYQYQSRPEPPMHTQSFNIPQRPATQPGPQIVIQPSLQRSDSFATISRMPIANGSRPQDVPEYQSPTQLSPIHPTGLQPAPQHSVYGNAGFSRSSPAFGATPTSPPLTYVMATGHDAGGRQTVDDNWETYGHGDGRPQYAPTVSTQLGEHDPPPPYTP